jgi:nucleoside-diphosphate-sugar epimerase
VGNALITGGAGFFGSLLKQRLLDEGFHCLSVDLRPDATEHPNLRVWQGDISEPGLLDRMMAGRGVDVIFHCAAIMAHAASERKMLWRSNVEGTRAVARAAQQHKVPKVVFISSNCLWARNFYRPVTEEEEPAPLEIYGRSKAEGEKILRAYSGDFATTIIRCPTIVGVGRLGLLTILFDFIAEGRRVWVVGKGENRYQFVYGEDLADACIRAVQAPGSDIFNAGSDGVKPMRDVYQYVIDAANTGARIAHLPKRPALLALRLAHAAHVSPLGPYHYRMIAEDFAFDTAKIKAVLGWRPTLTNEQMLLRAYEHYVRHRRAIHAQKEVSAHRQAAAMGVIRLVKWLS